MLLLPSLAPGSGDYLLVAVPRVLIVVSSLRSMGPSRADSVAVLRWLSFPLVCGIFLDQGSNPCPVHPQADS